MKKGDLVRLRISSEYFQGAINKHGRANRGCDNPVHCLGIVESVGIGDLSICVDWENKESNSYDEKDLEVLWQAPPYAKDKTIEVLVDEISDICKEGKEAINNLVSRIIVEAKKG